MAKLDPIKHWLEKGIISSDQAEAMRQSLVEKKAEKNPDRLIVILGSIGAILLGLGVILFFAANWEKIIPLLRVVMLTTATFTVYYLSYYFKYQKKHYPKLGASLIFLAAFLFGAELFLIAQIYQVSSGKGYLLVYIWLLGILPLAYGLRSIPIAGLAVVLFYIALSWWLIKNSNYNLYGYGAALIFLTGSLAIFNLGKLQRYWSGFERMGSIYRFTAFEISMITLLVLTFNLGNDRGFSRTIFELLNLNNAIYFLSLLASAFFLFLAAIYYQKKRRENLLNTENLLVAITFICIILYMFFPIESGLISISANLLIAVICLVLIYSGNKIHKTHWINFGVSWFGILIILRYLDLTWSLMSRSLFFISGGIILIIISFLFEKYRKWLKSQSKDSGQK